MTPYEMNTSEAHDPVAGIVDKFTGTVANAATVASAARPIPTPSLHVL